MNIADQAVLDEILKGREPLSAGTPMHSLVPLPTIEKAIAESEASIPDGPQYIREMLNKAGYADPILAMASLANDPLTKQEVRAALLKELTAYLYAKRQNIQVTANITNKHLVRFIAPERCVSVSDWMAIVNQQKQAELKTIDVEAEDVIDAEEVQDNPGQEEEGHGS